MKENESRTNESESVLSPIAELHDRLTRNLDVLDCSIHLLIDTTVPIRLCAAENSKPGASEPEIAGGSSYEYILMKLSDRLMRHISELDSCIAELRI